MRKNKIADKRVKRIDLRASSTDEKNLMAAAAKTGSTNISETIFQSVKQVAERVEFGCDRQGIRETTANIDYCRSALQALVNELKELTGEICTRDELEKACKGMGKLGSTQILENDLRDLVTGKLYKRLVATTPGLTVTYDNIKMPDLTRLFELSDLLDSAPRVKMSYAGCYWSAYEISDTGEVSIIETEVTRLTDAFRFTASNPDELLRLNVVNAIADSLNSALKDPGLTPETVISTVFYDPEAKRFQPTGAYIKTNHLQPKFERRTI